MIFPQPIKCVLATLLLLPFVATAKPWWMRGVESNENDFLPPDVAFRVASTVVGTDVRVRWIIADGYYLYRRRMSVQAESPGLALGEPQFPAGIMKDDPYLGTQEIFTHAVEVTVPYTRSDGGAHPLQVKVSYQGCAEAGLCYPPITKVLWVDAVSTGAVQTDAVSSGAAPSTGSTRPPAVQRHPWEWVAIIAGAFGFLWAGSLLRKDRRLETPTV